MTMNTKNQKQPFSLPWGKITLIFGLVIIAFIIYLLLRPAQGLINKGKGFNLLVITLDTMRADRLGAYGYNAAETPNIDGLAAAGVLFECCYAPVPITLPAHCSIFTGKYPLTHRVRTNGTYLLADQETTLAEEMKTLGYKTYAVIASYVLLSKFGLKQGFDFYDDSLNIEEMITDFDSEVKADQVYAKFNKWFTQDYLPGAKNNPAERFFAWVHFYDTHLPYDPPDAYKKKFGSHLEGRYNGEVAFVDTYVGEVIAALKKADILEHTLVVIAGDHGEAFGEHQEYGHSIFCYEECLKVPFILYNPKLFSKGMRIHQRINLIDIMPTLLDLYGLEKPGGLQGKSLVPMLTGNKEDKERTFLIESMHGKEEMGWAALTGIVHEQYKYISLPEPELYDLAADPQEKDNLFWKKNRLARTLDKHLMDMIKEFSLARQGTEADARRQLTAGDKHHLQTLGYISAFDDAGKANTEIDPKKGILLDSQFQTIKESIDQGKLAQAEAQLQEMAGKNPKNLGPQYFGLLNSLFKKKNDLQGVLNTWQEAIAAFPQNDNFKINLAFEYFHLNRLEEAGDLAEQILNHDPRFTKALILQARIREKRNNIPAALAAFEQSLALEPQNVLVKIGYARLLGRDRNFPKSREICQELLADEAVLADVDLKSRIGSVLAEIYQDDQAFRLLTEVKDAGKADAETWNYLGILYYRKKQFEQSLDAYRQSINLDPNLAKTYNNLGTLYLTLYLIKKDDQLRAEAMKAFNKALELEPALVSALNGRGSAYKFNKQVQPALADWQKAVALDPGFIDAYFNLGITYLEIDARPDALKYLSQLKEKFYRQLPPREQQRLDRLITEAGK